MKELINDYTQAIDEAIHFLENVKDEKTTHLNFQYGIEKFNNAIRSMQTFCSMSDDYFNLYANFLLKILYAIKPEEV